MDVIRGAYDKPIATKQLIQIVEETYNGVGVLYTGYPIIGTVDQQYSLDALMITPEHGVILFDVVEGAMIEDRGEARDGIFNAIHSKLLSVRGLSERRGSLNFDLNVVTFAPAWNTVAVEESDELIVRKESLHHLLNEIANGRNAGKYVKILESVQSITKLKQRPPRHVVTQTSKGAILNMVEQSISNLDRNQSEAVIETAVGIQRIRGLAGSGKTVILALKAAYLHAKYPDWKIGVTFYTRALKSQFQELITKFCIEQKSTTPDWDQIKIMQAWGSPRDEGFYYHFCKINSIDYHSYDSAKAAYRDDNLLLDKISADALSKVKNPVADFDVILIDEAQDFSESFLQLCYHLLKPADIHNSANKRLVYAYDELQKLNELSLREPHEIFGDKIDFVNQKDKPKQDVILKVCYRNSAPVLVTAHGLGFGIYRNNQRGGVNLVTMFQNKDLWKEVGYDVVGGKLELGEYVELARNEITSPELVTAHVPRHEILTFNTFENQSDQNQWIAQQIEQNLKVDELNHKDIIVIHPNAYTSKSDTAPLREMLIRRGVNSHLAGISTSRDEFFIEGSIAFTSIFRAKGNEAAMVYIMNTQFCYKNPELIKKRNILFTAITRSKGWVRACGVGENMKEISDEFTSIYKNKFRLNFKYPTEQEMKQLNVIHRDLSREDKAKIAEGNEQAKSLIQKLENKEILIDDLPEDVISSLLKIINGRS